jgi:transcriptional regulator with XRE-family HTH domain
MDMNLLADRLRTARIKKEYTQKQLAEMTGVSSVMISAYENKKTDSGKNPTLCNIVAISKALDVSIDWLCGLSEIPIIINANTRDIESDTPTFLKSIWEFVKNGGCKNDINYTSTDNAKNHQFIVSDSTILYEYISDCIKIKNVIDTGLLNEDMEKSLINDNIKKYAKNNTISDLFYNNIF